MNIEELRAYQLSQLDLLDKTDEICKKLNLTYYLIGGTLLGAVRHKGFIPWDADIDIAMPRKDYEAFQEYWKENPSEIFFYQNYSTERNHMSPHAMLRIKNSKVVMKDMISRYKPVHEGIYMDIFPLDTPPATEIEQEKQARRIIWINRLVEIKAGYIYNQNGFIKKLAKKCAQMMLVPLSFRCLNRIRDNCMKAYQDCNSKFLVSMASHYSYRKQLMPREVYGEPVRIEFEKRLYNAPAKTDEYLTRIYKNYMQIPKEENLYAILDFVERVDYTYKENDSQ